MITVFSISWTLLTRPDRANIDLLQPCFDEAAAGVDVVVGELLLHLADAEAVGDQLVRDRREPDTRA